MHITAKKKGAYGINLIRTKRLLLFPSNSKLAPAVLSYLQKGRPFLNRFEPKGSDAYYTIETQRAGLRQDATRAAEKSGFRFWLVKIEEPNIIIGTVSLSNIVYGAFWSCHLGYKCSAEQQGKGYTAEAAEAVCAFAFEELGLHRIEANIMPENTASLRVVEKLGFTPEGLAKQYLNINGVWEDHIHMVKLAPDK